MLTIKLPHAYEKDIVERARALGSRPLQPQWVRGTAEKAEDSFIRIIASEVSNNMHITCFRICYSSGPVRDPLNGTDPDTNTSAFWDFCR